MRGLLQPWSDRCPFGVSPYSSPVKGKENWSLTSRCVSVSMRLRVYASARLSVSVPLVVELQQYVHMKGGDIKLCVCVCVCVCTYLLVVELQQYVHLKGGDVECAGVVVELRVTQPGPLQPPWLTVIQTVDTLA